MDTARKNKTKVAKVSTIETFIEIFACPRFTVLSPGFKPKSVQGGVDFLSQGMVNNNLPITLEMYRRREADSALLKGTEVKLHPLKAGA